MQSSQNWLIKSAIKAQEIGLYLVELLSTSKHIDWYWAWDMRTIFPPLSDGLIISVRLFKCLSACIWLVVKLDGTFCHCWCLMSLMDWCKKAQMAGQVIRYGKLGDLGLNILEVVGRSWGWLSGTESEGAVPRESTEVEAESFSVAPSSYSNIRSRRVRNSSFVKCLVRSVNSRSRCVFFCLSLSKINLKVKFLANG